MSNVDVATKLASLLLLKEGELPISDIEALPFVEDRKTATAIARKLLESFPAEMYQRHLVRASGLSQWEDVVRLKSPVHFAVQRSRQSQPRKTLGY